MQLDQKISQRLSDLITVGKRVLGTKEHFEGWGDGVDDALATQWGTSCLHILGLVFTPNSDHYRHFSDLYKNITSYGSAERALGVLKAAQDDYAHDLLFAVREAVQAEVFDDFLSQAEYLLEAGYYHPAAVVAGSVLEDGLRKLCDKHGVALPEKPKLDTMNAELVRARAYGVLTQKQVTFLADLRNKAAHGQLDKFTEAQVATMLPQVRSFMATHFS